MCSLYVLYHLSHIFSLFLIYSFSLIDYPLTYYLSYLHILSSMFCLYSLSRIHYIFHMYSLSHRFSPYVLSLMYIPSFVYSISRLFSLSYTLSASYILSHKNFPSLLSVSLGVGHDACVDACFGVNAHVHAHEIVDGEIRFLHHSRKLMAKYKETKCNKTSFFQ